MDILKFSVCSLPSAVTHIYVYGTVHESSSLQTQVQLQRIISRCKCQIFYASYGKVGPDITLAIPPPVSHTTHKDYTHIL